MSSSSQAKATFQENLSQNFQLWAIKNKRCNPIAALLMPFIRLFEGIAANPGPYILRKQDVFGKNYCCAGAVWLGDFEQVEKALLEPQARTSRLGSSILDADRLPCRGPRSNSDRLAFLLALSQQGSGGNGDYEGFRRAVDAFVTSNDKTAARQKDATAKRLVARLAEAYKRDGHTDAFFDNDIDGLKDFLMRYIHYVLLGFDPFDEDKMAVLRKLFVDTVPAVFYFQTAGRLLQCIKFRGWPDKFEDVADLYMASPDLEKFPEGDEKYAEMSKEELAFLMTSIFSIAAIPGPASLADVALGLSPFKATPEHKVPDIDLTTIWDKLDLNNRMEVAKYLFECGRLRTPVTASHRVVTENEDFTVTINGKEHTFPPGTEIIIPLFSGMTDPKEWGPTVWEFNLNRENLLEKSMIFNSVGEKTNGRVCPGKDVAITMLSDVLIELGKVRRSPGFNKGKTSK